MFNLREICSTIPPKGERVEEGIINNDGNVPEASGLAYSRRSDGVLWTFNDGGETRNKVHAISEQGVRGAIQLPERFHKQSP